MSYADQDKIGVDGIYDYKEWAMMAYSDQSIHS